MAGLVDATGESVEKGKSGQFMRNVCVNCNQQTQLEIPQLELVNANTVSMLVFAHDIPQSCEHCGQKYIFVLGGYHPQKGIVFGFQPLQEQGRQVIPAPAGVIPNIRGR